MIVIGIGASAGGLEAMKELLSTLPSNTGASFVFLQHLSPDSKSIIGELIARHTNMPVIMVTESKPILANHIYVMPENKDLTYGHGMLIAHERDINKNLHLPIDAFFHTMGDQLGHEAIGILLSGTGTDGTRGLRTIKEKGGIVLIQDPKSAKFDGMPRAAIRLKIADQILTASEIGKSLKGIVSKRKIDKEKDAEASELKSPYFKKILQLIAKKADIDFTGYRSPTLIRRLKNRMLLLGQDNMDEYYHYMVKHEEEAFALSNNFLIGVTRFFRDVEAFEILEDKILPVIFKKKKPEGEPYRFWTPACSTGEEAYTIAMLLDSYIKKHNLDVTFKVFASDVDEDAIKFAIKGIYSYSVMADIPLDYQVKYFIKEGDEYKVKKYLRKKILFAVQNLIDDPPFIHMDLISCRNLLIYLKPSIQQKILATLHFSLEPERFLFLGPSESLGDLKYAFTKYTRRWNIFIKQPNSKIGMRKNFNVDTDLSRYDSLIEKLSSTGMTTYESNETDLFTQYLVERFAPISIFVNRNLDVLYMNGDVERILNMPRALARFNLSRMLSPDDLLVFKAGVKYVLENKKESVYQGVEISKNDALFKVNVQFKIPHLSGIYSSGDTFKDIVFIEIREMVPDIEQEDTEEMSHAQDHQGIQVEELSRQLNSAKKRSRELLNELEATNEELQTSNREMLAANEELQSTNEELQSVNEELYTVNSELQLKNEELSTANNDINNLLKSTEIGTIFLDKKLRIRKFTPAIRKQFDLLDSDINRPITNFNSAFDNLELESICLEVFESLNPFEQEVSDKSGDHYLLRILPYRTEDDNIDGLVINFIDINELVKTQHRITELARKYEAIFNNSYQVLIVLTLEGVVKNMNRPLGPFHHSTFIGNDLFDVLPENLSDHLKNSFDLVVKNNKTEKVELKINDNHWYEIFLIPIPDQVEGGSAAMLLMAQDNTKVQRSLQHLKMSLEEYKGYMDNASPQIALITKTGKIHYINRTNYTGKTKEELMGDSIYDYLPKENIQEYKSMISKIMKGEPFVKINFEFDYDGGKKGGAELIATPVILDGAIRYVAVVQNHVEVT